MAHLKNIFIVLLLLLICNVKSQITIGKIDSLQTTTFSKLLKNGELYKIVLLETKLRKECQRLNYKNGEIRGCLNLANVLIMMKKNEESLQMVEMAEKELKGKKKYDLEAYMYFVYGKNYNSLDLHEQAIQYFDNAFVLAHKIKDQKEKEKRLYSIYDWKRNSFEYLGLMDSVYSNERKCLKSPMPMLYITIAERHFKLHNIDSAEFYINKANELLTTQQIPIEGKANVLRAFGKLNIEKKNYHNALKYLFSSLKITSKAQLGKRTLESYKLIAEAYRGLNLPELANEYLVKYSALNDSLQQEENAGINMIIKRMHKEQSDQEKRYSFVLLYVILSIVFLGGVIVYFVFKFSKSRERIKDAVINEKVKESENLKRKLSCTYEELIMLAKQSDPSFMIKFKDSHSDFYDCLISKYPDLNPNDLKLCAFLKLDLSNKQIADYDHISIRTVESKKYRLRKKLKLSRDIDLYKWIQDF
ncbi:helix-turn-helix transcriptional regulator [Chryseobacterium sp. JV274]|uniref:helix-turn-helix transcriptional regulator n=1 Tax=Chryseobacterium sp. JV274 TaxID=1932669 RepID=UPI00158C5540|nr:LuxR C-terminal-related transcriptional regulator [Chryseobacterium sp. JV274]